MASGIVLVMTRKSFVILLKAVGVALLLFTLLFAGGSFQSSSSFAASVLRQIIVVFLDSETQWMVFSCLGIYFICFLFYRARAASRLGPGCAGPKTGWWLTYVLCISAVVYARDYSPSTPALTLLAGAVIGQGVAVLKKGRGKAEGGNIFVAVVLALFVLLLAMASVWNMDAGRSFAYHTHVRWAGPWENPNLFGLLMGTGVLLAVGTAATFYPRFSILCVPGAGAWRRRVAQSAIVIWCLLTVMLLGRGLLHSYSRGAWLATGCGGMYLLWHWLGHEISQIHEGRSRISFISQLTRNWFPLSVILVCTFVLGFWHFRQTEWHPAHRALSVVNPVDFSWRNRVAAWEGGVQIMAEHPWFGTGWNQPEPLYANYYVPHKLNESAAIEMNDYLMLGATLGIPALFCLGMYLWRSLVRSAERGARNERRETVLPSSTFLATTCRAGALVLLAGFWFDGGLFKVVTASSFWILLELGNVGYRELREMHDNG
jgi:hypothetical protein